MRTKSYLYHVQRRDALAFGEQPDVWRWDRFTAESEDMCALLDAFTVYGEQDVRDSRIMLDARVTIPAPGALHRVWAGYGLNRDEYKEAFA